MCRLFVGRHLGRRRRRIALGFALGQSGEFQQSPGYRFLALLEDFDGLLGSEIAQIAVGEFSGHAETNSMPETSELLKTAHNLHFLSTRG